MCTWITEIETIGQQTRATSGCMAAGLYQFVLRSHSKAIKNIQSKNKSKHIVHSLKTTIQTYKWSKTQASKLNYQ